MFNIIDKKIFTKDGDYLKTINCPKNKSVKDLESQDKYNLYCKSCEKNILDTDYISENKLLETLKKDKDICLKINRLNPMFRFIL